MSQRAICSRKAYQAYRAIRSLPVKQQAAVIAELSCGLEEAIRRENQRHLRGMCLSPLRRCRPTFPTSR